MAYTSKGPCVSVEEHLLLALCIGTLSAMKLMPHKTQS